MSEAARFFHEGQVAEKLGLPRDTVAYVRSAILKKEEGHWELRGRDVVLSWAGLSALLAHVFVERDPDPTLDFTDCEVTAEKKDGLVELTVKRLFPNRNLLQATLPGAGGEPEHDVTVRVRDNVNFRPRMKLKARPDTTGRSAFYQLEGRCPRYPGRY